MMIIEVDQFHSRYRPGEMEKLTLEQRGRPTGLIDAAMTICDVARVSECTKYTAVHSVINISRGNYRVCNNATQTISLRGDCTNVTFEMSRIFKKAF